MYPPSIRGALHIQTKLLWLIPEGETSLLCLALSLRVAVAPRVRNLKWKLLAHKRDIEGCSRVQGKGSSFCCGFVLSHRTTNIHQEGWKAESLMYSPLLYDPILHMHTCEMGHCSCPSYHSKLAHVVILYFSLCFLYHIKAPSSPLLLILTSMHTYYTGVGVLSQFLFFSYVAVMSWFVI